MAISSCWSSGCLVVIRCSHIPGRISTLHTGFVRWRAEKRMISYASPAISGISTGRRHEREHQDRDGHHEQQEARPAARVQRRFRARVLDRQLFIRLERVDGLVLRAVVLKDALDLVHHRDGRDVDEEEDRANHTVDGVVGDVPHLRPQVVADEVREPERRQDEQADAERERHEHRAGNGQVGDLRLAVLALR